MTRVILENRTSDDLDILDSEYLNRLLSTCIPSEYDNLQVNRAKGDVYKRAVRLFTDDYVDSFYFTTEGQGEFYGLCIDVNYDLEHKYATVIPFTEHICCYCLASVDTIRKYDYLDFDENGLVIRVDSLQESRYWMRAKSDVKIFKVLQDNFEVFYNVVFIDCLGRNLGTLKELPIPIEPIIPEPPLPPSLPMETVEERFIREANINGDAKLQHIFYLTKDAINTAYPENNFKKFDDIFSLPVDKVVDMLIHIKNQLACLTDDRVDINATQNRVKILIQQHFSAVEVNENQLEQFIVNNPNIECIYIETPIERFLRISKLNENQKLVDAFDLVQDTINAEYPQDNNKKFNDIISLDVDKNKLIMTKTADIVDLIEQAPDEVDKDKTLEKLEEYIKEHFKNDPVSINDLDNFNPQFDDIKVLYPPKETAEEKFLRESGIKDSPERLRAYQLFKESINDKYPQENFKKFETILGFDADQFELVIDNITVLLQRIDASDPKDTNKQETLQKLIEVLPRYFDYDEITESELRRCKPVWEQIYVRQLTVWEQFMQNPEMKNRDYSGTINDVKRLINRAYPENNNKKLDDILLTGLPAVKGFLDKIHTVRNTIVSDNTLDAAKSFAKLDEAIVNHFKPDVDVDLVNNFGVILNDIKVIKELPMPEGLLDYEQRFIRNAGILNDPKKMEALYFFKEKMHRYLPQDNDKAYESILKMNVNLVKAMLGRIEGLLGQIETTDDDTVDTVATKHALGKKLKRQFQDKVKIYQSHVGNFNPSWDDIVVYKKSAEDRFIEEENLSHNPVLMKALEFTKQSINSEYPQDNFKKFDDILNVNLESEVVTPMLENISTCLSTIEQYPDTNRRIDVAKSKEKLAKALQDHFRKAEVTENDITSFNPLCSDMLVFSETLEEYFIRKESLINDKPKLDALNLVKTALNDRIDALVQHDGTKVKDMLSKVSECLTKIEDLGGRQKDVDASRAKLVELIQENFKDEISEDRIDTLTIVCDNVIVWTESIEQMFVRVEKIDFQGELQNALSFVKRVINAAYPQDNFKKFDTMLSVSTSRTKRLLTRVAVLLHDIGISVGTIDRHATQLNLERLLVEHFKVDYIGTTVIDGFKPTFDEIAVRLPQNLDDLLPPDQAFVLKNNLDGNQRIKGTLQFFKEVINEKYPEKNFNKFKQILSQNPQKVIAMLEHIYKQRAKCTDENGMDSLASDQNLKEIIQKHFQAKRDVIEKDVGSFARTYPNIACIRLGGQRTGGSVSISFEKRPIKN